MLKSGGFITVDYHQGYLGGNERWDGVRLSWPGHEFLNAVRDDTVWVKTKEKIASTVGTASVSVLSQVAGAIARGLLGL